MKQYKEASKKKTKEHKNDKDRAPKFMLFCCHFAYAMKFKFYVSLKNIPGFKLSTNRDFNLTGIPRKRIVIPIPSQSERLSPVYQRNLQDYV